MGIGDKIKNAAENAKGKAKEGAGKVSDDPNLETEGRGDQASSDVKSAGEDLKDGDFGGAAGNAKDAFNE